MLDHVFVQAIGAVRRALDAALLERHSFEERYEVDILLGDTTWETAYTLPGEGVSPRAQATITFEWSTWSQTAYRSWSIGEPIEEPPEITMEILFRLQRLAEGPDATKVLAATPEAGPPHSPLALERKAPAIEQQFDFESNTRFAIEVSYDGSYEVPERVLEDLGKLDDDLGPLGGWIASTLVRLTDLDLAFLPPDVEEDERH